MPRFLWAKDVVLYSLERGLFSMKTFNMISLIMKYIYKTLYMDCVLRIALFLFAFWL